MPTQRELNLANEMRIRVSKLRDLNYSEKKLTKLIKSLDIPLGLKLNLLSGKR